MKVIDKREEKEHHFGDLKIGECFFDSSEFFCIKTSEEGGIYLDSDNNWDDCFCYASDCVVPVEVELHIIGQTYAQSCIRRPGREL